MQTFGLLVVDDLVRFECGVAVINLHAADGGNAIIGVVVVNLVRLNEHLLLTGLFAVDCNLGFFQRRRAGRELQFLRWRWRRRDQSAASQQAEDGGNTCDATAKQPRR